MFSCSWISCFIVKTNKHNLRTKLSTWNHLSFSESCAFSGPCELKPCAVCLPEQLVPSRTKTDYSKSTTTVYLIVSFFIPRASALLPPQSREAINWKPIGKKSYPNVSSLTDCLNQCLCIKFGTCSDLFFSFHFKFRFLFNFIFIPGLVYVLQLNLKK